METETNIESIDTGENVDLAGVNITSNGQHIEVVNNEESVESDNNNNNEQVKSEDVPAVQATEEKELENARYEQEETRKTLEAKGINYGALEAEYLAYGELSEDSYKQLSDKGYDRHLVNMVIAGWQAKADNFVDAVIKNAGGDSEYKRVCKFVEAQGREAIEAFNDIVETSSLGTIKVYIQGIKAQMVTKYGTNNPSLTGGNTTGGVKPFRSIEEMTSAMADPRYENDPAYRKDVEKRVAKSKIFG